MWLPTYYTNAVNSKWGCIILRRGKSEFVHIDEARVCPLWWPAALLSSHTKTRGHSAHPHNFHRSPSNPIIITPWIVWYQSANSASPTDTGSMLVQRQRRWTSIEPVSVSCPSENSQPTWVPNLSSLELLFLRYGVNQRTAIVSATSL